MNRQLTDLLSICRRAGRMTFGFDSVKDSIESGKAALVLLAEDISPKTEKEIRFFADKKNVTAAKSGCTMEDFFTGIGKKTGTVAVCDEGFAKKALSLISDKPDNITEK